MTAKGQARGPNHYIDPPNGTVPQELTGVEIKRSDRPNSQGRARFNHTAQVIADNIGSWCLMTTYPLVPGHDMVKVADSMIHRLNRTGRKGGMLLIERKLKRIFGVSCFDVCKVEAKLMQQPDGTIKVMIRWVPLEDAA